ncbi:DNA polymerase, beta domain protein region [uncultured Candidatus Thioglobus sp.]|nr:DNA polymerase, beta domain protein region [uncultured Candidatus Thioglobus sp.]
MRLSKIQRNIIKQTAKECFDDKAKVKLFGSRVDETLKGGDIDLLLEFNTNTVQLTQKVLRFNTLLQKKIGAQKIDIITLEPHQIPNTIQQQALKTGLDL